MQYFAALMASLCPQIILIKYMLLAAKNAGIPSMIVSQLQITFSKPVNIIATFAIGFMSGFPSTASYAYNSKNYKRVFSLMFYSLLIPVSIMASPFCF